MYAACLAVVAVVGVRALHPGTGSTQAPFQTVASPVVAGRRPPGTIVVDVAGAVRRPGVYRFREGQRVRDAVRRAGGPAPGARLAAINRAARLADGQQVVVPERTAAGAAPQTAPGDAPVSLSSASAEQLQTLDGVGPVTAQKIVDFRSAHGGFRSLDQLAEVPGIGPKRLAALKAELQP